MKQYLIGRARGCHVAVTSRGNRMNTRWGSRPKAPLGRGNTVATGRNPVVMATGTPAQVLFLAIRYCTVPKTWALELVFWNFLLVRL